jgi:uncharacterized integral membrane protein (TIGR00698 family)
MSTQMLENVPARLLWGIVAVVAVAILLGYLVCRAMGLSTRMAVLIACGNSICGNSAIAAIAPVIRADPRDVASAIAFTAILGMPIVIGLPWLVGWTSASAAQYGAFAGLTIYSVPQVIAATLPVGTLAVEAGTLTKLVRVTLLAPVAFLFSLIYRAKAPQASVWSLLPPWFIFAFFGLMAARSGDVLPSSAITGAAHVSNLLNLLAMAALGLSTDMSLLLKSGPRVTLATLASMTILAALSYGLIVATA